MHKLNHIPVLNIIIAHLITTLLSAAQNQLVVKRVSEVKCLCASMHSNQLTIIMFNNALYRLVCKRFSKSFGLTQRGSTLVSYRLLLRTEDTYYI